MINVDLPDGPGGPLARGLAACLSSVTEVPLSDLPDLGDAPAHQLLGAYKSWLAGRGFGLVPIYDPRTFQWAGYWFAIINNSGSPPPEDSQRQVAVLAFGTPPGIVLRPQDPDLLGRATADLHISSVRRRLPQPRAAAAFPRVRAARHRRAARDRSSRRGAGQLVQQSRALAGHGLEGDRYADGAGTFSPRGAHKPGYELTLIAAEVVEELTARDARLDFASTRRNVLTRGIDVNALVGREFTIGDVRSRGLRLAEPCARLERIAGPGLLRPLIHRGGLRVDILNDGMLHTGSTIGT